VFTARFGASGLFALFFQHPALSRVHGRAAGSPGAGIFRNSLVNRLCCALASPARMTFVRAGGHEGLVALFWARGGTHHGLRTFQGEQYSWLSAIQLLNTDV